GAGSRVSACGKYADLCRQRTARAATTTTIIGTTTVNANDGRPKAVMAYWGMGSWGSVKVEQDTHSVVNNRDQLANNKLTEPENHIRDTLGALRNGEGRGQQETNGQTSGVHPQDGRADVQEPRNDIPSEQGAIHGVKGEVPESGTSTVTEETGVSSTTQGNQGVSNTNQSGAPVATESQSQQSNAATMDNQESSDNTADNSTMATSTTNGTASTNDSSGNSVTAAPDSQETNSTTPASTENTVEAPTTTPSSVPIPDTEITTVASIAQKKANVDSSISPVWMRTAAPLLIVAVLLSVTVC
ncbi:uncharacterized protein TM35_000471050, partial [Trypanosoma theileri]